MAVEDSDSAGSHPIDETLRDASRNFAQATVMRDWQDVYAYDVPMHEQAAVVSVRSVNMALGHFRQGIPTEYQQMTPDEILAYAMHCGEMAYEAFLSKHGGLPSE